MNRKFKDNIGIISIVILFLSIYFLYINFDSDLWWDSSVYIGMGKYIYSSGQVGLYEDSRPLVWPLILGFFWKIGFDVILFGKLAVLGFGVGTIVLTYVIAYEFFNKKIALLSSLLLAFSPTFFLFNSILFTGIPSTFFALLGFYLFIKKLYPLSGLVFGIAFMTRFFQILVVFPIYIFFIYLIYKRKATIKEFIKSILFFFAPIIPFFILNLVLHNNPFHSFLLQAYMTKITGWVFHHPFNFYFINLVRENALILFSVLGIIFILKYGKSNRIIIPFVFLFVFVSYNLALHKEMRFLLPVLPFLYMLVGYGIVKFSGLFKKYKNILLLLILAGGIFQVAPQLRLNDYDDKLDVFYDFMQTKEIKEGLWISNPSFIVYTDSKADELIYYPLYNTGKMTELQSKMDEAKYVLINTCDIMPCPLSENLCSQEHNNFLNSLKEEFYNYFYEKLGECEHYIFTTPI